MKPSMQWAKTKSFTPHLFGFLFRQFLAFEAIIFSIYSHTCKLEECPLFGLVLKR